MRSPVSSPLALLALLALLLAGAAAAPAARAQETATTRLRAQLAPAAYDAVTRLVDSARAASLPTAPLMDKALEGVAKRADGARIVAATRALHARMLAARAALGGASASEGEIVAGAAALQAGVPREALTRLRGAQPGRPLVVALVVLGDLVARGVPADTAAVIVGAIVAGTRDDGALLALRDAVQQDISAGASPAAAAELRARSVLAGTGPSRMLPPATAPVTTAGSGTPVSTAAPGTLNGTSIRAPQPRPRP